MTIKRIRAVDRALLVIETLSHSRSLSLVQLRQHTGLDNATLLRILSTLIDRGWVRQLIVEKKYELSHSIDKILGANQRALPIAELAAPILLEMRSNPLNLPSEVSAIVGDGIIEIVESTRLRGRMAPVRTGLGLRPSMFQSAHGRTILSAMPEALRQRHVEAFLNRALKNDVLWHKQGYFDKEMKRTMENGYGRRQENYWEPPFDDAPPFGAIAVPIQDKSGIHGSISLIWLEDEISFDTVMNADMLAWLQSYAKAISSKLTEYNIIAPN